MDRREIKVLVAHPGSRMHYAVPRILARHGMLHRLFTDLCVPDGLRHALGLLPPNLTPPSLKRLLGRRAEEVPDRLVTSLDWLGLESQVRLRLARAPAAKLAAHRWFGPRFCRTVVRHGLGSATHVYAFNSTGLEVLAHARSRGVRTVLEQTIAPYSVENRLMGEERASWPSWEADAPAPADAEAFAARERQEWMLADQVLCPSEFVRDGIGACGGPVERCRIVWYGVDISFHAPERPTHNGPLRVLTLGAVGLRKGAPYVLEAARRMRGRAVFRMAGSIGVSEAALSGLRQHVEMLGPIPRSEIAAHYAWADVFLLPSVCEGSATVIYEALSCGLPVVCTPNAGSVVCDGVDGFIVPIRDARAITDRLDCLAARPSARREMSRQARERARELTLDQYGRRLIAALRESHADALAAR